MPSILLPIIISETEPWSCLCSVEDRLQVVNSLPDLQCHTPSDTQASLTQQDCWAWKVCYLTHSHTEAQVSCPHSPPPSQRCGLLDPWPVFSVGHLVSGHSCKSTWRGLPWGPSGRSPWYEPRFACWLEGEDGPVLVQEPCFRYIGYSYFWQSNTTWEEESCLWFIT